MTFSPDQRIVWADGDVLTAAHFRALEAWIEGLVGASLGVSGLHGLVRPQGAAGERLNRDNSVTHTAVWTEAELTLKISVRELQAITPAGRLLRVGELSGEIKLPKPLRVAEVEVGLILPEPDTDLLVTTSDSTTAFPSQPRFRSRRVEVSNMAGESTTSTTSSWCPRGSTKRFSTRLTTSRPVV